MSDYLLSDVTNFQVIDMPYDVKLLAMDILFATYGS